jgi:diguanylate cyclase (GGDEF)-like protein
MPPAARVALVAGVALVAVYGVWLVFGTTEFVPARDSLLYCLAFVPTVTLFALRFWVADDTRPAWAMFGAAASIWALAEVAMTFTSDMNPSGAIWVQFVFLAVAPLIYVGLAMLIRAATPRAALDTYLDGIIIALALGAVLALVEPWSFEAAPDTWSEMLFALSYPSLDLLQVALILAAIAVLGRSTGPAWWLLLAGSTLIWLGDSYWLFAINAGDYVTNSRIDVIWPLGMFLMACAAWTPLRRGEVERYANWGLPLLVTSAAFALIVYATFADVPVLTTLLATGAVVAGVLRSISAFRAASARTQAQLLAQTDDLTGLTNRRGLVTVSENALSEPRALLLVDIDRFKQINDTLGHQAGDDVLQEVATRFRRVVGGTAVISRIGGDEFAILTGPGSGYSEATQIAAGLHACVREPVRTTGIDLSVELSVGIAVSPAHGRTLSALLLAADRAMYRAKREHINTQVFDPQQESAGDTGNLLLLQELRSGIRDDQFVCFYQPQLDVLTNEIVAVEALVRWRHPEHGLVPAGHFLPMLEQTTLIRPLTDAILHKSLTQLQEWDAMGLGLRMCVNISATNLLDRALPLRITHLLASHHIASERLTLEITETALSGDEDRVRMVLSQLHEIGVEISIDDYGSGYSSLHQIGTLGAQELKLDREFVTGVGERGDLRSILAATVHLAHGLRLRMVAEGVESASDLDQVRLSGCDLAQGFYISAPRDGASLVAWLQERAVLRGDDRLRY